MPYKMYKWAESRLRPLSSVLAPEISGKFANSNIYVYSQCEKEKIRRTDKKSDYKIKIILDKITGCKGWYSRQKYTLCNKALSTQVWMDLYQEIGESGILSLYSNYTVMERYGNRYILHLANDKLPVHENDKNKSNLVKIPEFKEMKEVKAADVYSKDVIEAYTDEISTLFFRIQNDSVSIKGIIGSFIKAKKDKIKEKRGECAQKKPTILDCEIQSETVVRLLYTIVKNLFSGILPENGLMRVKRKIRWMAMNKKYKIKTSDLLSGLKTNFKPKIRNNNPLLYKKYMTETYSFIFLVCIPNIMACYIKDTTNQTSTPRFFFRQEFKRLENQFKDNYIKEYFQIIKNPEIAENRLESRSLRKRKCSESGERENSDVSLLQQSFSECTAVDETVLGSDISIENSMLISEDTAACTDIKSKESSAGEKISEKGIPQNKKVSGKNPVQNRTRIYSACQKISPLYDEVFRMNLIPKSETFRPVFKKVYNPIKVFAPLKQIHQERMVCCILTREAQERAEWEIQNNLLLRKRQPRVRTNNSIFRVTDIFPRVHNFRSKFSDNFANNKPLYILILDIKSCFDNISTTALNGLNIIQKLFGREEYEVYTVVETSINGLKIVRRKALYPNENIQSEWEGRQNRDPHVNHKTVFKAYQNKELFTQMEIKETLDKEINHSILQHRDAYYKRAIGINQGSRYASHMCGYFLAALDPIITEGLVNTHMARYVDDSVLFSWSLDELSLVVERIKGLENAGVILNMAKCKLYTSIEDAPSVSIAGIIQSEYKPNFKWCGMHFDTKTLFPIMVWEHKPIPALIYSKKEIFLKILLNLNIRHTAELFHSENPNKYRNAMLFIKCQIQKLLCILENKECAHMREACLEYLLDRLKHTFIGKGCLSQRRVEECFYRTLGICQEEMKKSAA
ncbi:hypothetical protein NEIRO02_1610 [Nematocida sp. AWRm79]|nr:hypothetical protein NEIRO02_1610 [Nematocida sp. AWRm79]